MRPGNAELCVWQSVCVCVCVCMSWIVCGSWDSDFFFFSASISGVWQLSVVTRGEQGGGTVTFFFFFWKHWNAHIGITSIFTYYYRLLYILILILFVHKIYICFNVKNASLLLRIINSMSALTCMFAQFMSLQFKYFHILKHIHSPVEKDFGWVCIYCIHPFFLQGLRENIENEKFIVNNVKLLPAATILDPYCCKRVCISASANNAELFHLLIELVSVHC